MSGVNDPPRLFEADDAPAALRDALSGAHEEGLSQGAVERIAAGVEAQIGGPGTPTDPSGTGSPGGGTSLLPTSPAGKLGAALIVAAVGAGSLWMARGADSGLGQALDPAGPPAVTVSVPDEAPTEPVGSASEPEATTIIDLDALPQGAERAAGGNRPLANPQTVASSGVQAKARPSLEEIQAEHQLLRAARNALDRDPKRSLALTQEHKRRFPDGMLAQEREVIAIEALRRMGKGSAARSRADRFGDDYPDSPHSGRVDAVAADAGAKK